LYIENGKTHAVLCVVCWEWQWFQCDVDRLTSQDLCPTYNAGVSENQPLSSVWSFTFSCIVALLW